MTAAELDWEMDSLEGRKAAVRHYTREHSQMSDHAPDGTEMYDEHRTQAEVDLTLRYAAAGVIPESLAPGEESTGPHPVNFYGVKSYVGEWQKTLDRLQGADREDWEQILQERLEELQTARENKRKPSYRDGSYNQFLTYNRYFQGAVHWLLGDHPEQEETDE